EQLSTARKSRIRETLRRLVSPISFLFLLFLPFPAHSQTVVGPLSSTPNSIPTFVDATGKKITNNPSLIYSNNVLYISGVPFQQNSFTTNSTGKTPALLTTSSSPLYPLMILLPDGSGSDRTIGYSPNFFMSNGVAHFLGNVMLSGLSSNTL